MVEQRKLYKKEKKYVLEIDDRDNDYLQIKGYTKDELRDVYKGLKTQINTWKDQLAQLRKKLKQKVEYTEEEKKIKEIIHKLQLNNEADKAEIDAEKIKKDLELFESQKKEIEKVVPELKRSK